MVQEGMREALCNMKNMVLPEVRNSPNSDPYSLSQISQHAGAHLIFQSATTVTMLLIPRNLWMTINL